jgi:hypothetical protein
MAQMAREQVRRRIDAIFRPDPMPDKKVLLAGMARRAKELDQQFLANARGRARVRIKPSICLAPRVDICTRRSRPCLTTCHGPCVTSAGQYKKIGRRTTRPVRGDAQAGDRGFVDVRMLLLRVLSLRRLAIIEPEIYFLAPLEIRTRAPYICDTWGGKGALTAPFPDRAAPLSRLLTVAPKPQRPDTNLMELVRPLACFGAHRRIP